ncbi:MAG TPA: SpoIIE family protein phosphatase [Dehalococcoidia bacterium]|nr:SpoIIE family protein phosphatase [Dehalococcoidia bacterium]
MVASVLVVDDDVDLNRALTAQVRRAGHEVRSAFSGAEGLAQLAAQVPDAVLLDVQLGDMSGLDVLEVIRERYAGVIVILMTAQGSEDVAASGLRLGADDYLRKPFRPAALFGSLDRALAQQALLRENELLRAQAAERAADLQRELDAAARIQGALLEMAPFESVGITIHARCQPARELGGDFFDYGGSGEGRVFAVLGDVSGKGLPAALVMTLSRSLLRAALRRGTPEQALTAVNREIFTDLEAMERFVTGFVCSLDPETRLLRWSDAGHGYAVVLRGGEIVELQARHGGPPLGIVPEWEYALEETPLRPGDEVLVFSDGLLERDELRDVPEDTPLTPGETVRRLLDAVQATGGEAILDLLARGHDGNAAPARDDETALLIRVR